MTMMTWWNQAHYNNNNNNNKQPKTSIHTECKMTKWEYDLSVYSTVEYVDTSTVAINSNVS